MGFSSLFPLCAPFFPLSLFELSICSLSSPTLLWNLGCYRGNTGDAEDSTEGHRTGEGWKKRFLPSRPYSFRMSCCPFSAISSPSPISVSPIRCSKKSIRLSLPPRFIVFSFYGTVLFIPPYSFLSRLQCDTLRHALRGEPLQRVESGTRGIKEVE